MTTAANEQSEYFAVDIQRFCEVTRGLHFDVYLKLGDDKMTRVFSQDTGVDFKRLAQYIAKGVKELYINKKDASSFAKFVAKTPGEVLANPQSSVEDKTDALGDMADQSVSSICESLELAPDVADKTKLVVRNMVKFLHNEPSVLANLLKTISQNDSFFYHSVTVSVLSMLIAEKSENSSEKMLELIGLAGLLHDIGKSQLSKEVLSAGDNLTREQSNEMKKHPKLSFRMLEGCRSISDEVRLAILQHHEQPNGEGYPNALPSSKITFPARVIAIADTFASLITNQPNRKAYTPEQAIEHMMIEQGKFDRVLLQRAAELFSSKHRPQKKAA